MTTTSEFNRGRSNQSIPLENVSVISGTSPENPSFPVFEDRSIAGITLITRLAGEGESGEDLSRWGEGIHPKLCWIPLQSVSGTIEFLALLPDARDYPDLLPSMIGAIARGPIVIHGGKKLAIVGIDTNRRSLHRFSLFITGDRAFPESIARALHAMVLDWFRNGDPALSESLHRAEIVPFTLAYRSVSERKGRLTITLLEKSLLSPLLWGMARDFGRNISLASVDCRIGDCLRWESSEDYGSIAGNVPLSSLTLRFLSPTSFKQDRAIQSFPLPELVFTGLWRKWNRFAPDSLALPLVDWRGFVTAFDLKTGFVSLGDRAEIGCVGRVGYRFPDPEVARIATILGRFASYAGVGRKTTFGMGKTRLLLLENYER